MPNAYVRSKSHEVTRQGQVPLFLYYSVMGAPAAFDSGLLETTETPPKSQKDCRRNSSGDLPNL